MSEATIEFVQTYVHACTISIASYYVPDKGNSDPLKLAFIKLLVVCSFFLNVCMENLQSFHLVNPK